MSFQMLPRRPSSPILVAISAIVILLLIILTAGPSSLQQAVPRLGSTSAKGSLADVFNHTLGFEKIFVVGLPARTDRRDAMILSSALSDMEVEFIDGVLGETVLDSVISSPNGNPRRLGNHSIGSWRGHMNAIQEVVRRNLTSAIIFEDDADWDVRLKPQLYDFALSSRALLQPLSGSASSYADSTYPKPTDASQKGIELAFENLPATASPETSPYGDNWDILWLGHCGMKFAKVPGKDIPKGRVVLTDPTVPQRQHLRTVSSPDELKNQYPDHTRVVHHSQEGICSLVYAVSQAGARKLLFELGIRNRLDTVYDLALRQFCEGTNHKKYHNCLTVQPSLFHHHLAKGPMSSESDISSHGEGNRETAKTPVIRYSTRMNWETLLAGKSDFVDQWPDA